MNDYKIITSTKKLSYHEQNVNWFDSYGNFNAYKDLTLDSYKNSYSYFNIMNIYFQSNKL